MFTYGGLVFSSMEEAFTPFHRGDERVMYRQQAEGSTNLIFRSPSRKDLN
jgi:hypothetical protein